MKTEKQEENKNIVYEAGCLFLPIVSDKDVLAEVSNIKKSLEKLGFEFLSGDGPNMRDLAYPMEKMVDGKKNLFEKAYFVWLKFKADPEKLADLKVDLDENKNLLRYLLIKTIEKDILVSDQKKILAKISEEKQQKAIKPAKVTRVEKPETVETKDGKEPSSAEATDGREKKDLDDTIDKLVIK
ncbi:MAG: 30S ribosomal protein S6 [Patescibacteria group bacterium]|nr:30S ribosomal protein S6 [Patescibacteria group bacterium]